MSRATCFAFCNKSGQVMILATLSLGGVILGATTIAGMLTAYQIRRATDFESSAKALFAADAGVECALYNHFKSGSCAPSLQLSNGASYDYVTSDISPPSPIIRWTFDEGIGPTVTDSSGNVNNGAWNGTGSHWFIPGKVGNAAGQFNGIDDYVLSPDLGAPPLSVTLTAWVKPPSAAGGVVFSELGQGVINSGWHDSQMEVETDGTVMVCVWVGIERCTAAGSITYDQWSHLAMVYDSGAGTITGYVNGSAGNPVNVAKQYPGALYYAVGAADSANGGNGSYYSGFIDDVRVYGTALREQDIFNLYNGIAPSITVLSAGTAGQTSRAFQFTL